MSINDPLRTQNSIHSIMSSIRKAYTGTALGKIHYRYAKPENMDVLQTAHLVPKHVCFLFGKLLSAYENVRYTWIQLFRSRYGWVWTVIRSFGKSTKHRLVRRSLCECVRKYVCVQERLSFGQTPLWRNGIRPGLVCTAHVCIREWMSVFFVGCFDGLIVFECISAWVNDIKSLKWTFDVVTKYS
jgi:hypothetical protein